MARSANLNFASLHFGRGLSPYACAEIQAFVYVCTNALLSAQAHCSLLTRKKLLSQHVLLGQELVVISCGATRLGVNPHPLSAYKHMPIFANGGSSPARLLNVRSALRSPFIPDPCTALPAPAALCDMIYPELLTLPHRFISIICIYGRFVKHFFMVTQCRAPAHPNTRLPTWNTSTAAAQARSTWNATI